jgi:predicted negative regulator of RcsB-dependent stress response
MALDLEEQEQLASLKGWWKDYGGIVVFLLLGVALALAGWRGWQWYESSQAAQAAAVYDSLGKAVQAGDAKAVRDASGSLIESYPRTAYAAMSALAAARFLYDSGDLKNAKTQREWLAAGARFPEFRDTARLRLAAMLLDEKAYEAALRTLEGSRSEGYESQFSALRGDVLIASGKPAEAKSAYQAALETAKKSNTADTPFHETVRLRLEALGG